MATWKELGRFLEHGTPVLDESLKSLQETRQLLSILRPTLEAAPALVKETHALVVDTRNLLATLSPMLIELAKRALAAAPDR